MWQLFKEFLLFLRQEKKWWLVPLVVLLLLIGAGLVLKGLGLMESMLFGISPLDAGTWMLAALLMTAAAMAAALIPARRASKVDPLIAIRAE